MYVLQYIDIQGVNVKYMIQGDQFSQVPIARVSEELGRRLNVWRLSREMKVADLADEMGVSRPTLQRLLEGENTSTETFLRALLALGLIENLDVLVPDVSASPLARLSGGTPLSERKRVSSSGDLNSGEAWTWGKMDQTE
jgi:transcriptional regulator with XRE-family HTH domain